MGRGFARLGAWLSPEKTCSPRFASRPGLPHLPLRSCSRHRWEGCFPYVSYFKPNPNWVMADEKQAYVITGSQVSPPQGVLSGPCAALGQKLPGSGKERMCALVRQVYVWILTLNISLQPWALEESK